MPLYEVSSLVVIATETASDSTTDTAEEQEDDHFVEPVEPIDEGPPSPYNFPVLSEDDVETESTSTDFFVVEDTDEFVVQMKLKSRTPSTSHLGKTSKAVQVDVGQTRSYLGLTGRPVMMLHRKWRESKQQPSRARSGHQISCCLVYLHFLPVRHPIWPRSMLLIPRPGRNNLVVCGGKEEKRRGKSHIWAWLECHQNRASPLRTTNI